MRKIFLIFLGVFSLSSMPSQGSWQITSSPYETPLIELYTSEGCSSCPPADAWMSRLVDSPDLWKDFVPVVWHVDYWDYIGWKDPLALKGNSYRQVQYERAGKVGSIYTPQFIHKGKEWRGFFKRQPLPTNQKSKVGQLSLSLDNQLFNLAFEAKQQDLIFHIAILGMDISNKITRGENAGRHLKHDFVVLHHQSRRSIENTVQGILPNLDQAYPRYAIAAWVTRKGELNPIQALGNWLPNGWQGAQGNQLSSVTR